MQVVSPRNHMVFTPLLASACVGTIEPRSTAIQVVDIQRHLRDPQKCGPLLPTTWSSSCLGMHQLHCCAALQLAWSAPHVGTVLPLHNLHQSTFPGSLHSLSAWPPQSSIHNQNQPTMRHAPAWTQVMT